MALAAFACCAAMAWLAYDIALRHYQHARANEVAQRASFYALSLDSQLARYESIPRIAALEPVLLKLLNHPDNAAVRIAANAYLKAVQANAQLAAAYVMDAHGVTLAASNWDKPSSFVGSDYVFRPYFTDAMKHGLGRFYGVGNTTGEPGYFLAVPILDARHPERSPLGVIAIKAPLDNYESALTKSGDMVLLTDLDNVVFLTSVPEWRYRALVPLSDHTMRGLRTTLQYGDAALTPLTVPLPPVSGVSPGSRAGSAADERATPLRSLYVAFQGRPARRYGVQYKPVGPLGWKIAILVDSTDDRSIAALSGIGAAAATALFFALLTAVWLRYSRERERHRARLALQQAGRQLEARIVERTVDLTLANVALAQKVDALDDARRILRDTRDTAIQAGKLAALGQMAAGITHELNQPLAALMTLSNNAVTLAERDRPVELQRNLALINELAARMGAIISHVKAFARYDALGGWAPVAIKGALLQALALVEPHRKTADVTIRVELVPDEAVVLASSIRIEQVLVNLLTNAIDACAAVFPRPDVVVTIGITESAVRISVEDGGNGIAPHVLPRLFEPFYTTKASGQGLGLGLAISQAIVDEFSGRLEGRNRTESGEALAGAVFIVELPRVTLEKAIG
jgi:two-component system C4-dicarboxylate transport sensor histidine kinase DctB